MSDLLSSISSPGAIGLVARGTILLALGWCVARALRRAPAGARHLVWLAVIVSVLLLPGLSRVATFRVAVLPAAKTPPGVAPRSNESQSILAQPVPARAELQAPIVGSQQSISLPAITTLLLGAWLLVTAVLLGWFAMGTRAIRRIIRRGRTADGPEWARALHDAANRLALTGAPRLVVSDEVETAFACDALSPTIVLPASAIEWSNERRRAVLLHEVAHIKRRDLVGQLIARTACAAYWFHPMVWIAARRLRAESELACDAMVVESGVRASDYAQHLLDMVSGIGARDMAPAGALPIVRPTEFEGRLVAILDRSARRGSVGRAQSAALLGMLGLLAMSTAAVVPVPRVRDVPASPVADTRPSLEKPPVVQHDASPPSIALSTTKRLPAALSGAAVESLRRDGTAGIINPMLMILRDADSLGLTAAQADSVATLSRAYMIRLNRIWAGVSGYYARRAGGTARDGADDRYLRAPEETIDALKALAPNVLSVLTEQQRARLPERTASYLNTQRLSGIRTWNADAMGLFGSNFGGFGGGRRGRVGGSGR